jgi:hypothetical protein
MNHAKFCPAIQGRSTPESLKPFALLPRCLPGKQEEDHAGRADAMALRVLSCRMIKPVPRKMHFWRRASLAECQNKSAPGEAGALPDLLKGRL